MPRLLPRLRSLEPLQRRVLRVRRCVAPPQKMPRVGCNQGLQRRRVCHFPDCSFAPRLLTASAPALARSTGASAPHQLLRESLSPPIPFHKRIKARRPLTSLKSEASPPFIASWSPQVLPTLRPINHGPGVEWGGGDHKDRCPPPSVGTGRPRRGGRAVESGKLASLESCKRGRIQEFFTPPPNRMRGGTEYFTPPPPPPTRLLSFAFPSPAEKQKEERRFSKKIGQEATHNSITNHSVSALLPGDFFFPLFF